MFHRIAHSEATEDSERAIEELKSSKYWESDHVLTESFTKIWLKVKELILTAKTCKYKIIFQAGNVLSDNIMKTDSLHIYNKNKMELLPKTSI